MRTTGPFSGKEYVIEDRLTGSETERARQAQAQSDHAAVHGTLPTDAKARKDIPLARGVLDYFPDALAAVAEVSRKGNEQHNPGQPLHWAKEKSTDHADCIVRHLIDRGKFDTDGGRHSAKIAWRALALLQIEIEQERAEAEDARGNR